ncbi:MAG: flagellar basal-body rod protein FlgG [Deltaproteobacteria bacterium]|nr:flagellar basal-body rod protein FlgG [Deltaproteobacteria bacterium]
MIRALWTAASGMEAQQLNIDVIANNLANVNTTGFKRSRADFQDLLYQTLREAGASSSSSTIYPTGMQIGLGTRNAAIQKIFQQGEFQQTQNPLDFAIEGRGFFQILQPNGETGYSRAGSFKQDEQGRLVTSDGFPLVPQITIPADTLNITVGSDGTVSVMQAGQNASTQVGQIQLVSFANPSGLKSIGRNLYTETASSGSPTTGTPGENGVGTLAQGFLELSNVNISEELINMIVGQRAYEINSKAIQTADEMMQTANNTKR